MSKRFTFDRTDFEKWSKNLIMFSSIPVGTYLLFVQGNLANGFEMSDFVPNQLVLGTIVGYFVSSALDFLKKFSQQN